MKSTTKKLNSSQVRYAKIQIQREEILHSALSRELIQQLLEEKHSFAMIRDLLERDYPQVAKTFDCKMGAFSGFMRRAGYQLRPDSQKTSTAFRVQYKFPKGTSIKDIEEKLLQGSRRGAKTTRKIRENWEFYIPKYSVEFWKNDDTDQHEAEEKLLAFKRSISPFYTGFWLKRGFTQEEAALKVNQIVVAGAVAALKKCSKPKTEVKYAAQLKHEGLAFETQVKVSIPQSMRLGKRRFYVYDFLVEDKKLVDCHGMYWHASPKIYRPNDILRFPGREVRAQDIWAVDAHRAEIARSEGYDYVVVWEDELIEVK